MATPLGTVYERLGSLSQVYAPLLLLRIYLYEKLVPGAKLTVTYHKLLLLVYLLALRALADAGAHEPRAALLPARKTFSPKTVVAITLNVTATAVGLVVPVVVVLVVGLVVVVEVVGGLVVVVVGVAPGLLVCEVGKAVLVAEE